MSERDRLRIDTISGVVAKRLTASQAATMQGVTVRQVRRQLQAFREKGAEGLIHGNRGRPSARRTPEPVRERVRTLLEGEYADYNTSHLRDDLETEQQISLSYSTLYRLRAEFERLSPRRHKVSQHRQRRERAARQGQLVQVDGSDHAWLQGRGPRLTLIAFVDDATGLILGATFRQEEDTMGYMQVLHMVCRTQGLPQTLYSDRHTLFQSPKQPTLEQKLRGERPLSHFGRTLAQLGIARIAAQSPQAKGRVERLFGTLQDRLVKELRRHHADTLAEANAVLAAYLPKYNQRFGRTPAQPETAFRPWPPALVPEQLFACHYTRLVGADHTIAFGGLRLPIPCSRQRRSYARAQVDLYLHYSGTLTIEHQGVRLAQFHHDPSQPVRVDHFVPATPIQYAPTPSPEPPPAPSPAPTARPASRPPDSHPWRHSPIGRQARVPEGG